MQHSKLDTSFPKRVIHVDLALSRMFIHFGFAPKATELLAQNELTRCTNRRQSAAPPKGALFDHLIGGGEQCGRHVEAERLGSLEVDHQLELDRLLDWDITRSRPAQKSCRLTQRRDGTGRTGLKGHQASRFHELSKPGHHRQSRPERQCADEYSVRVHKWVANDVQRIRPALEQLERRIDVRGLANL